MFRGDQSDATIHKIKDSMYELKGDVMTFNSSVTVTPIIGLINFILVSNSYMTK